MNNLKNLTKITLSCNLITNIEENDFHQIDTLIELWLFGNYLGIENKTLHKNINDKNIELLKKFGVLVKNKFKNLKGLYLWGNFFTTNDDKENENYKSIIKSIIPEITIDG